MRAARANRRACAGRGTTTACSQGGSKLGHSSLRMMGMCLPRRTGCRREAENHPRIGWRLQLSEPLSYTDSMRLDPWRRELWTTSKAGNEGLTAFFSDMGAFHRCLYNHNRGFSHAVGNRVVPRVSRGTRSSVLSSRGTRPRKNGRKAWATSWCQLQPSCWSMVAGTSAHLGFLLA